jgi:DNA-binding XRE family transcriptional regulator
VISTDELIGLDKFCCAMKSHGHSPIGMPPQATASRARRSRAYRNARDEYARIRALRKTNPIAAHLRERRFELGLTQEQVADAAGTSHTAISRLENGTHMPQLTTLRRIAAVLGEELLLCFQRIEDGEVEREFAVVA